MEQSNNFSTKIIKISSRSLIFNILKFENGIILSISENLNKLGSMMLSIGTGPTPIATMLTPSKKNFTVLRLIAEPISTSIKGIVLVSMFTESELTNSEIKLLLTEVKALTQNV